MTALHTRLLTERVLAPIEKRYPVKIVNITNGIDHRRWLIQANPPQTELLKTTIGNCFAQIPTQLGKLLDFREDEEVLRAIGEVKQANKRRLLETLGSTCRLDPDSVFIVQAKRFHLYKRQRFSVHIYIRVCLPVF